jgi:bla regulator protein blaR1
MPAHAVLARPLTDTPSVVAAVSPLASPRVMTAAILPRLAPLLVSDLVPAHGVSLARVDEPMAPPASSVLPAPMPMPIRMRQPIYPQNALARGIEGQVVVEFGLAVDGSLQDMRVISAQPADVFDQAAIQAMRGWKYALPTDALMQRRYRQTLVFTLNAATRGGTQSSTHAGEEVQARVGCRVATGTLICRLPGDMDSHADEAAVQQ